MNIFKQKNILYKRKGMTLIEIIISLALLSIILVPFLTMFVQSAFTIKKSEVVLDGTYVAQRVMEDIYNDSQDETIPIPPDGIQKYWDSWGGNYWIYKEVSVHNKLVTVLVRVYSDDSESELEAQMETKLLWIYNGT